MKTIAKKAAKGKAAMVSITFRMRREENEAIKEVCDSYRLGLEEVAHTELGFFYRDASQGDDALATGMLEWCNELKSEGLSTGFIERRAEIAKEKSAKKATAA